MKIKKIKNKTNEFIFGENLFFNCMIYLSLIMTIYFISDDGYLAIIISIMSLPIFIYDILLKFFNYKK